MTSGVFRYVGYEVVPSAGSAAGSSAGSIVCRYSCDGHEFVETITFDAPEPAPDERSTWSNAWSSEAAHAAARIVFLLAGVSYFKTTAPPVIDLGTTPTTAEERTFLRAFYVEGLAEFAYRNGIDLSGLSLRGPELHVAARAPTRLSAGRPLIPFGAGIDSVVTAAEISAHFPEASLFVVSPASGRFRAIEDAAGATGLPVVRAERRIDPAVLRSSALGLMNGHVPVTGIISAIAVMAAVLGGYDAVVMSNERSASVPTVFDGAHAVNHQWSKGADFEAGLSELVHASFDPAPTYSSYLRDRSELWVAEHFASLERYHGVFRSCNRAFAIDPAQRLDHWCGVCDKCCFVDLVLAPFMTPGALGRVFSGHEPLADERLTGHFWALCGIGRPEDAGGEAVGKPFECVGDEGECRAAVLLAAERPDRSECTVLQRLATAVRELQ